MDREQKKIVKKVESLAWALIFIWLGVYLFLDFEREGILAIGLGVILLLENYLRHFFSISWSKLWTGMGILFILFGVLDFFDLALFPFLLIGCGLLILYRYVFK